VAKKQTQIERAIARLEADVTAKQAAIAVLREEQALIDVKRGRRLGSHVDIGPAHSAIGPRDGA
jgi:hypothetical protein